MILELRHLTCILLISIMASACQPAEGLGDSVTDPAADAGESGGDEPTAPPEQPNAQQEELDLNDVSILLPPPTSGDPGLAITDLAFDGASVWPDSIFTQYLGIAENFGGVDGEDVVSGRGGSRIDISAFTDKSYGMSQRSASTPAPLACRTISRGNSVRLPRSVSSFNP